jgi:hypothetical protein
MISYWECKLKVNGQPKSIEIVGENPTFEKYENRIKRNFSPKDKIEFIAFVLKVGLIMVKVSIRMDGYLYK